MGDCGSVGADIAVELEPEAGLNADSDPTSEFVTQGEKKGISMGTNTSSQCTLLARNFSMTSKWMCGHAPLRL